jgi:hypothetical protein
MCALWVAPKKSGNEYGISAERGEGPDTAASTGRGGGGSGRQRKIGTGRGRGAHRGASRRAGRCDTARWIMALGVNGLGVYPAILEEVVSAQQRPGPCIARHADSREGSCQRACLQDVGRMREAERRRDASTGILSLQPGARACTSGRILQGACLAQHTSWRHSTA